MPRSGGDEKQLRAVVLGRVQGVGFRYFVQREANRLGLKGWVRNLESGNVEVVAKGPPDALGRLLDSLNRGPQLSWVQRVNVEWQTPDGSLLSFEIKQTGW